MYMGSPSIPIYISEHFYFHTLKAFFNIVLGDMMNSLRNPFVSKCELKDTAPLNIFILFTTLT